MKIELGESGRVSKDYRDLYEAAAKEARQSFTLLIETISEAHIGDLDWFLSSPASRNTFTSTLFTRCCQIGFLKKLLGQGTAVDAVVTDSPALAEALRLWMGRENPSATVTLQAPVRNRLNLTLGAIVRLIGYPAVHLWHFLQARSTRSARSVVAPSSPATLIDTFVMSGYEETDRYYPGMLDGLTDREKASVFFVPTFYRIGPGEVRQVFKRLRAGGRNFLFKEDYLKFADYLFAFGHAFRVLKIRFGTVLYKGVDVSGLIREEIRGFRRLGDTIIALLNTRFAVRLSKAGVPLRLVVDWFENQVGDKGWNAGFNTAYPRTPTVGYRGFVNTEFYLCDRPTPSEQRSGLLPKTVGLMGKGMGASLCEFCPGLPVESAPAFRFAHLHANQPMPPAGNGAEFNILVALPFSANDARRILSLVNAVGPGLADNVCFGIKPHPTASTLTVPDTTGEKIRVRRLDGDFSALLTESDLLVSTASSVCMESLAMGIPVIVVGNPNGLTLNPIPDSVASDLWRLAYSADDMRKAIRYFWQRSNGTIRRHRDEGKTIRDDFFTPVTKRRVRAFLRL
jgi:hypothetical protein